MPNSTSYTLNSISCVPTRASDPPATSRDLDCIYVQNSVSSVRSIAKG